MSSKIEQFDYGFLSGNTTWHRDPKFVCVGNRPITLEEGDKIVGFPIEKRPTFVELDGQYIASGSNAIVRTDHNVVLASAVGDRYEATPHKDVYDNLIKRLLTAFPDVKICGTMTLSNGATWVCQMVLDRYYVNGDESPTEERLFYTQTYGVSSHIVAMCRERIVCANTLKSAIDEGLASKLIAKIKHTASAKDKIDANLDVFAEMHLGAVRGKQEMDYLSGKPILSGDIKNFIDEFMPLPVDTKENPASTRAKNLAIEGRWRIQEIFATGQSLIGNVQTSRYALLNSFTDFIDHHSYVRKGNEADRWLDGLYGDRSKQKVLAKDYLLSLN